MFDKDVCGLSLRPEEDFLTVRVLGAGIGAGAGAGGTCPYDEAIVGCWIELGPGAVEECDLKAREGGVQVRSGSCAELVAV